MVVVGVTTRGSFPAYVSSVYPSVEGESRNFVADQANDGGCPGIGREICNSLLFFFFFFRGQRGAAMDEKPEGCRILSCSLPRSLSSSLFFFFTDVRPGKGDLST